MTLTLSGCRGFHSALDPAGPQSTHISNAFHFYFWVTVIVYTLVVLCSILAIRKMRSRVDLTEDLIEIPSPEADRPRNRIITALVILTTLILVTLVFVDFITGQRIHAFAGSQNQLVITVTGHQWWWEIQYQDATPSNIVTTANEIHIPVGRPVEIQLRSGDVIHSFWIPNLHGKKDAFPDHDASLWLQADREGLFDGQCAEFCGAQHAQMRMQLVAESQNKFQAWLQNQRQSASQPQTEAQKKGQQVFMSHTCVTCHTIQGTDAGARLGPNLTHVASRQKIAAGTIPNTTGHLAGWIVDPQKIKPGVHMPQNPLKSDELLALLEYLESLK